MSHFFQVNSSVYDIARHFRLLRLNYPLKRVGKLTKQIDSMKYKCSEIVKRKRDVNDNYRNEHKE